MGWFAILGGVLMLALGFGAGFLTSQLTDNGSSDVADAATTSLIESNVDAYNAQDADALAATYTPDAVITYVYRGGWYTRPSDYVGPKAIDAPAANVLPWRLVNLSLGDFRLTSVLAAHDGLVSATFGRPDGHGGVVIYEVGDGKIRHQWLVMSDVMMASGPRLPDNFAPAW